MYNKIQDMTEENSAEIIDLQKNPTIAKTKKQLALKIVTAIFYGIITFAAIVCEALIIPECFGLTGWEGLALIVLIPFLIIIPVASAVLYIIPLTTSIVGLIRARRRKDASVSRSGKIFFGAFIGIIILSVVALALASGLTILAIKLTNG